MTTNSSMSVNASRLTVFHLLYLLQNMSICNAYGYSNTIGQRTQYQMPTIPPVMAGRVAAQDIAHR